MTVNLEVKASPPCYSVRTRDKGLNIFKMEIFFQSYFNKNSFCGLKRLILHNTTYAQTDALSGHKKILIKKKRPYEVHFI